MRQTSRRLARVRSAARAPKRAVRSSGLLLSLALLLLNACSGSDNHTLGNHHPDASAQADDDASTSDTPSSDGTVTITVHADVTRAGLLSGWVYKHVGVAAVERADINQGTDALCTGTMGGTKCVFTAKVGQTVTLIATDLGDVSLGGYSNAGAPMDPRSPNGAGAQFDSWSAPCATPSRGVCVFEASEDQAITVQFKDLTLTHVYFTGLDTWRYTIDAPPDLKVGAPYTGADRHIVYDYGPAPAVTQFYCLGGDSPELCWYILTPDGTTLKFEALPPPPPMPVGSPGALAFTGWGGACSINGKDPTCSLTSGVDQTVVFKWEYYTCEGNPGVNDGTSGWKFPPGTFTTCTVHQPP